MPVCFHNIFISTSCIRFNDPTNSITIDEPENNGSSQLRSVKIRGFEDIYYAIKLDLSGHPFLGSLVNDGDLKKTCDALIFARIKGLDYIILIELKSQTRVSIPEKFRNCLAIIEYVKSITNSYYNYNIRNFKQLNLLFDRQPNTRNTSFESKIHGVNLKHKGFGKTDVEIDIRGLI